jgi:hypothetical protein
MLWTEQLSRERTFCAHPDSERSFHLWIITQELEQERGPRQLFTKIGPLAAYTSWLYRHSDLKSRNLFSYNCITPEI